MVTQSTVLVIGPGDLDFVPLVVRLCEQGIKVVCVTKLGNMAQDGEKEHAISGLPSTLRAVILLRIYGFRPRADQRLAPKRSFKYFELAG